MSRKTSREATLRSYAEAGKLSCNNQITCFKREISGLRRDGFTVTPLFKTKRAIPCVIDWSYPFDDPLDKDTSKALMSYVNGYSLSIPTGLNFAQRLYAIATRANKNNK